jgi:hypothetical protein
MGGWTQCLETVGECLIIEPHNEKIYLKVEELEHSEKKKEKILRKYEWNMQTSGTPLKDQT